MLGERESEVGRKMTIAEGFLREMKNSNLKAADFYFTTFGEGHSSYQLDGVIDGEEKAIVIIEDPKFYSITIFEGNAPVFVEFERESSHIEKLFKKIHNEYSRDSE